MARTPNKSIASPATADRTNTLNKGFARSSAPSPSLSALPVVIESVETESLYHHHLRASHHHRKPKVARSNAPSPPFISASDLDPDPDPNPSSNRGPAPSELMYALSKLSKERERERQRSNAPSPSPTLASEEYHRTITEIERDQAAFNANRIGQAKGGANSQKHRLFRSAAPSPDREVTPPTGTGTGTGKQSSRSGSGIVAPRNTPVKKSQSSGRGTGGSLTGSPTRMGHSGTAGVMQSQAEEGEYSANEFGDEEAYACDPSSDPELQKMYRYSVSSITNTVSVVNSSAVEHVGVFGTFAPGAGGGRGQGGSRGEAGEMNWNPPLAQGEMQSHLITWINGKKVGERINGVQVPTEEGDYGGFGVQKDKDEGKNEGRMDVEGIKEEKNEGKKHGIKGLGDKLSARKKDGGKSPDKKGKRKN
ncbi:hypothetical protein VTL71DRAFT_14895 [Oculimacula yallundae]|uniref:Uncharacterized protein n=1 Tax=Oculimacula yallundae TaxID=86028 RepID=A0ABR4CH98_9HELO